KESIAGLDVEIVGEAAESEGDERREARSAGRPRPEADPRVVGGDADVAEVALVFELDLQSVDDSVGQDLEPTDAPGTVEAQCDVRDDVPLGARAEDADVLDVDFAPGKEVEAVESAGEFVLDESGAKDDAAAEPDADLRALRLGRCDDGDRGQEDGKGDAVMHAPRSEGRRV